MAGKNSSADIIREQLLQHAIVRANDQIWAHRAVIASWSAETWNADAPSAARSRGDASGNYRQSINWSHAIHDSESAPWRDTWAARGVSTGTPTALLLLPLLRHIIADADISPAAGDATSASFVIWSVRGAWQSCSGCIVLVCTMGWEWRPTSAPSPKKRRGFGHHDKWLPNELDELERLMDLDFEKFDILVEHLNLWRETRGLWARSRSPVNTRRNALLKQRKAERIVEMDEKSEEVDKKWLPNELDELDRLMDLVPRQAQSSTSANVMGLHWTA
ncbi:hypothetical protein ANO11243_028280 [Dothideomycetidae sp. 11243]|nr:hypothetical protein ANO11243_028280 [fungal sp. No.11243]